MESLIVNGEGLTIEDIVAVARHHQKVVLHPEAIEKIVQCRAMLEKKIEAREIMYGVNTGIGEFSEVVLTDDQVKDFQKYLIYKIGHFSFITIELNLSKQFLTNKFK